jgi:hypothetical protein
MPPYLTTQHIVKDRLSLPLWQSQYSRCHECTHLTTLAAQTLAALSAVPCSYAYPQDGVSQAGEGLARTGSRDYTE